MLTHKINMLFGEITESNVDYKVSLNQEDEDAKRYDYLANKISSKNLSLDECKKNKSLIYCEITKNNKILLSPLDEHGGDIDKNSYDIIIDSYPILDSTYDLELSGGEWIKSRTFLFPMQIATGKIKRLTIFQSQNLVGTMKNGYIGIYGNDIPTAIGSRLLFDTISTNAKFSNDGVCTFSDDNMPEIKGVWVDEEGNERQNTFLYVVFFMEQDVAGYKILSRISPTLSNLSTLSTTTFGLVTNFDRTFHPKFDYDVDKSELDKIPFPYMNITMVI